MFVPEDKLSRVECLLEEVSRERFVKVRRLVKMTGMIGSFYLVMGNVCRFHTRGMISQIANVVEKYGWNGGMKIGDRVVIDLEFWRENLRDLNVGR